MKDKPKFSEIADEFINYISDSKIIIHNASFDVGFLNAELIRCNMKELNEDKIIDTLVLAKKFVANQSAWTHFVENIILIYQEREIHGALKDAKLLASVYLELIGGRQSKLDFEVITDKISSAEEDHLFNLDEYYRNMSLKKVNHLNINKEDYKLHLKAFKQ